MRQCLSIVGLEFRLFHWAHQLPLSNDVIFSVFYICLLAFEWRFDHSMVVQALCFDTKYRELSLEFKNGSCQLMFLLCIKSKSMPESSNHWVYVAKSGLHMRQSLRKCKGSLEGNSVLACQRIAHNKSSLSYKFPHGSISVQKQVLMGFVRGHYDFILLLIILVLGII